MSPRNLLRAYLLVVAVALGSFATSLDGAFVNWDDHWLLLENPFVKHVRHLPAILDPIGDRGPLGAEYLPLRDLHTMAEWKLFGLHPRGYRLQSLLLYGLAAALVFALLQEGLRDPRAALAGALLWAAHPLHAEVVPWFSAQKDLLNGVFALAASVLYLRSIRTGRGGLRWWALGAFVLATLSKTSAAAVPAALVVWDLVAGDAEGPSWPRFRRALLRGAPLLAVAAAGAALNARHQTQEWIAAEWRGGDWVTNLFVMAGVHLRYLRQMVLPWGLSPVYAVDGSRPDTLMNLAGLAVLAGSLAASAWLCRRRPRAGWAALWWFLVLFPVSSLAFPLSNASADRYLFLPSIGLCALAGLGFARARDAGPRAARVAAALLAVAVLALGIVAARQCRFWRNGLALWTRAKDASPDSATAWLNYSESLYFLDRNDESIVALRRMIQAGPLESAMWMAAGERIYNQGGEAHVEEVEEILRTAVKKARPGQGGPLVALAWLVNMRGRPDEAVELLREALRRQPDLAEAHYNLGLWHWSHGRWSAAATELEEALRIRLPLPQEIDAHDRLFGIWEKLGDPDRARHHREERERKKALMREAE